MVSIKPIETIYNGYRFRSRLEARWAVFFDAAGIEYQYELEGFVLRDGTAYLPDFFLPQFDVFVEVKANSSMNDGKSDYFAFDYTGFNQEKCNGIIKAYGDPASDEIVFHTECCIGISSDHRGTLESECFFARDRNGKPLIVIKDTDNILFCVAQTENGYNIVNSGYYKIIGAFDKYEDAMLKARQARFEHGEKPNSRG